MISILLFMKQFLMSIKKKMRKFLCNSCCAKESFRSKTCFCQRIPISCYIVESRESSESCHCSFLCHSAALCWGQHNPDVIAAVKSFSSSKKLCSRANLGRKGVCQDLPLLWLPTKRNYYILMSEKLCLNSKCSPF